MPCPPHTAALSPISINYYYLTNLTNTRYSLLLGVPGQRSGAAAKLGERWASKVGLPGVGNNRYHVQYSIQLV